MRNDFSNIKNINADKLDLSSLKTLSPREDSWEKVCARLDQIQPPKKANNILPFRLLSAIPIAASLLLVGISVTLTAFNATESNPISMNEVASTELTSWYQGLGQSDTDDFETLENSITISYLLKE